MIISCDVGDRWDEGEGDGEEEIKKEEEEVEVEKLGKYFNNLNGILITFKSIIKKVAIKNEAKRSKKNKLESG